MNAAVRNRKTLKVKILILLIFIQVPCDKYPDPPTDCTSGYASYDKPDSCYVYVCNEVLEDVKAADRLRVAAAYLAARGTTIPDYKF